MGVLKYKKHVLIGTMVGANQLTNFEFDQSMPYGGCRICGTVWQPAVLRNITVNIERKVRIVKAWRKNHALSHTAEEHRALALSGLWALPEAQQKLAPFGIIDMTAYTPAQNDQLDSALLEAPRAPVNDADGMTTKEARNLLR